MMEDVAQLRNRLSAAAAQVPHAISFMEVCGTHTVAGFRTGLHAMLPANVKLLSGPGCPVCVTAQGDIDLMVDVALESEGHAVYLWRHAQGARYAMATSSWHAPAEPR